MIAYWLHSDVLALRYQELFLPKYKSTHFTLLPAWGLTMAAYRTNMPWNEYWWTFFDGVIATIVMRTSACTVNDIFDRQLDACVGEYQI